MDTFGKWRRCLTNVCNPKLTNADYLLLSSEKLFFWNFTFWVFQDHDILQFFKVQSTGKLKFSETEEHHFCAEDLVDCGEIGRGNFGAVNKMMFRKAGRIMAVKRIRFGQSISTSVGHVFENFIRMKRMNSKKITYFDHFFGHFWPIFGQTQVAHIKQGAEIKSELNLPKFDLG